MKIIWKMVAWKCQLRIGIPIWSVRCCGGVFKDFIHMIHVIIWINLRPTSKVLLKLEHHQNSSVRPKFSIKYYRKSWDLLWCVDETPQFPETSSPYYLVQDPRVSYIKKLYHMINMSPEIIKKIFSWIFKWILLQC